MNIDWNNPQCKISKYFTVGEATYLASIKEYHIPSEEEKTNIIEFAKKMDSIRELVQAPISVHCWIRPISVNCNNDKYQGFNYNAHIGSKALKSAHISGIACDFHVKGFEGNDKCASIRNILLLYLDSLGIRMEDIQGNWIHVDMAPVKSTRFFKP
jgi:hypothetical protein